MSSPEQPIAPRQDLHEGTPHEDASAAFADLNDHDTVYRTACGCVVKVKRVELPKDRGAFAIRTSAALCGEDGKALRHAGRPMVAPWHDVVVSFDGPHELEQALAEATQIVVDRVARMRTAHEARKALPRTKLSEHADHPEIRAQLVQPILPAPDQLILVSQKIAGFPTAGMPPPIADRFDRARAAFSLATRVVDLAELIYANRAQLDDNARLLGAGLARVGRLNGWGSLADPRGGGLEQAQLRELGVAAPDGHAWPEPEADPEPLEGSIVAP